MKTKILPDKPEAKSPAGGAAGIERAVTSLRDEMDTALTLLGLPVRSW